MILVPIPDYPDYLISNTGRLWSTRIHGKHRNNCSQYKFKELKGSLNSNGYRQYGICNDFGCANFIGAYLVLSTFTGSRPPGMQVCHNDGDRTNDNWKNLRWGTRLDNAADRVIHGTDPAGVRNPNVKLTLQQIEIIRLRFKLGLFTRAELAEDFNVQWSQINRIVSGQHWKGV